MKVLSEIIPLESLAAVHVYFPDPWWRKRIASVVSFGPGVVKMIEARLRKEGAPQLLTDVKEYFDSGVKIIKLSTNLAGPFSVVDRPATDSSGFNTHFERRTLLNEEPVYRSYFEKRRSSGE